MTASKSIPTSGSGASASAGYAFFENKFGYNFKSYDKFATDDVVKTIIVGHEPAELESSDEKDILSVDSVRVSSSVDVLKGLNIGSYSSNVMTVDLFDMNYKNIKFDINKYYDNVPLLNKGKKPKYFEKFKRDTSSTRIMSKIVDTALFTEGTHTAGLTKQLSQASLREKLFYNKFVDVEYIGKFDLTVGQVVELETFKGRSRELDEENSGKYVIARLERTFYSGDDMMGTALTLVTDSPGHNNMYESTANFIGKDGFNWWIGQVENIGDGSYDVETKEIDEKDFDYNNKVKVRIVGYHNSSRAELPTKHLPWAQVLMPPIYAQKSGIGSHHQLQLNSWVVGFYGWCFSTDSYCYGIYN